MSFLSKISIALLAVVIGSSEFAYCKDPRILEFEGRQKMPSRELHFSYVFLPAQGVIIQLNFDAKGNVDGIGHGMYSKKKGGPFEIRWQEGGFEKGNFDAKGNYRISYHTDKSQRGTIAKGRLQYLKDPKRMEFVVTYVQKVVSPILKHQAALRKQLQELEYLQFKTSMDILEMWTKALD